MLIDEPAELIKVAAVVAVKQFRIERGDCFVELLLILDFVERRDGLGVGPSHQHKAQTQQEQNARHQRIPHGWPFLADTSQLTDREAEKFQKSGYPALWNHRQGAKADAGGV